MAYQHLRIQRRLSFMWCFLFYAISTFINSIIKIIIILGWYCPCHSEIILNSLAKMAQFRMLAITLCGLSQHGVGWLVGLFLVLWHINHCRLFDAKSTLYIYIKSVWFGLVGFYGISTIVGYLMPNPLYTYILNMYDLVWLGFMAYQPL